MSRCDILQKELFRRNSTYQDDYHQYPICNKVEDNFKCIEDPFPGENIVAPLPLNYDTLCDRKTLVPFNLFHRPKEILKTNPHCYRPKFPAIEMGLKCPVCQNSLGIIFLNFCVCFPLN